MNEYQSTKKYLQTLKQVRQEKGLWATIKHELISSLGSLLGRYARANNYCRMFNSCDMTTDDSSDMGFREVWRYNREIEGGRLRNILNPNLFEDLWVFTNWTER